MDEGLTMPGAAELARGLAEGWCRRISAPQEAELNDRLSKTLHPGEVEAIIVCVQRAIPLLCDDQDAVSAARRLGVVVTGTLGLLVKARQVGRIAAIQPLIQTLRREGMWIEKAIEAEVLRQAGEER